MLMKPPPPNPELDALIRESVERYRAMSPGEKAAMHEAQRRSWVRAELAFGDDADEARYRAAGDAERECLDAWMTARADWLMSR